MKGTDVDILSMLVRHELAIKELYEIFAATFPDRQGLWSGLAGDEQRHADMLEALDAESNINSVLLGSQIKPQAIMVSIAYVESLAARAQMKKINPVQALSVSKDLESALLEMQFSQLGNVVSQGVRGTLIRIARETDGHWRTLVDALEAEKG